MKTIRLLLYYLLLSNLPNSWWPGGKLYNFLRIIILRGVICIGNNCRIQRKVYIGDGNNIEIGNKCYINENVRLDNVKIGNNVMIARETIILGKMHNTNDVSKAMTNQGVKKVKTTIIEDDVWIGLRVIVMPGVKISKGTILAAGTIVTKDTEPYSVYGGVPSKLIKKRN